MIFKPKPGYAICPKCHRSQLKMAPGESRTCPICGNTWKKKEGK